MKKEYYFTKKGEVKFKTERVKTAWKLAQIIGWIVVVLIFLSFLAIGFAWGYWSR